MNKSQPKAKPQRPMPTDPKELAQKMFRQADQKMFGGRVKQETAEHVRKGTEK